MRNTHETEQLVNEVSELTGAFDKMRADTEYELFLLWDKALYLQNQAVKATKELSEFKTEIQDEKQNRGFQKEEEELDKRIVELWSRRKRILREFVVLALDNGYLDNEGVLNTSFDLTRDSNDNESEMQTRLTFGNYGKQDEDYLLTFAILEELKTLEEEKSEIVDNGLNELSFSEILGIVDQQERMRDETTQIFHAMIWSLFVQLDARSLIPDTELENFDKMYNDWHICTVGSNEEKKAQEILEKYLKENIPNYDNAVLEITLRYKKAMFIQRIEKISSKKSTLSLLTLRRELKKAEALMEKGKWEETLEILDKLEASSC
jgi:hypothetical protein